jgi:hypothetical protein
MPWATRTTRREMEPERILSPEMLQPVEVMVLKDFGIGDTVMKVGTTITVSRHRAEYLRFLQLVDYATIL